MVTHPARQPRHVAGDGIAEGSCFLRQHHHGGRGELLADRADAYRMSGAPGPPGQPRRAICLPVLSRPPVTTATDALGTPVAASTARAVESITGGLPRRAWCRRRLCGNGHG